jgi:drug/metabolite transporter (DMT)-like permease
MIGVVVGLLCATTWACGSILIRDLSRKLDPFTLNAPRALVGGLTMLMVALATGRTQYTSVNTQQLFFLLASVGVGGGIGDTFYVRSLTRIGVSRAFPVASIYPAITLILGMIFLREQPSLTIVLGLALVVGGILLIGRRKTIDLASKAIDSAGLSFALIAALAWALSYTLLGPGMEGLDSIMVASFRTPALALVLFGIVAMRGTFPKLKALTRRDWVILVVGGIIGWGLGSMLFLLSVQLVGPTRAAILTSTAPLFALPMSVIFLKEEVNRLVLVGTAITVLGVILVA